MSEEAKTSASKRTTWVIVAVVAAVVIVAVVLGIVFGSMRPTADAAGSPTSTSTPSPGTAGDESPAATAAPPGQPTADPATPFPELAPVAPGESVTTNGIVVALTRFENVQGEVVAPGEVAGPAVRVTVSLTNDSDQPLNLDLVVVNAYIGDQRDPAEPYQQPGGSPVNGSLAPGDTAEGVYLFRIPEDRRGDVAFVVDYLPGQSAVAFRGPVP